MLTRRFPKQRRFKSYLRDTHPELRAQFVKALDARNSTFDDLASQSGVRCVWQCPQITCEGKCPHTWETTVSRRTSRLIMPGCPVCAGQKVCRCHSFGVLQPDLLKEYSHENTRSPFTLAVRSSLKVKWVCNKATCNHHVWEEVVANRTGPHRNGCPFCASRRCCPCYNLKTEFPDIASEFCLEKNAPLTPDQFLPSSNKKVWWFCKVHNFHWDAIINGRTRVNSPGCRYCKMSGLEFHAQKALQNLLEKRIIVGYEYDKRLPGTRLKGDFWVTLTNGRTAIIEMDGGQHFFPVSFGGSTRSSDENFQNTQRLDREKRQWCEKNHVHLLRISYKIPKEDYEHDLMEYFEWCKEAPDNLSAISHIHLHEHTITQMEE